MCCMTVVCAGAGILCKSESERAFALPSLPSLWIRACTVKLAFSIHTSVRTTLVKITP